MESPNTIKIIPYNKTKAINNTLNLLEVINKNLD